MRTPPVGVRFLSIAAGGGATCGITTDHDVECWAGDYYSGECAGRSILYYYPELSGGRTWESVVVTSNAACALSDAGELGCIGYTGDIDDVPPAQ